MEEKGREKCVGRKKPRERWTFGGRDGGSLSRSVDVVWCRPVSLLPLAALGSLALGEGV